MTAEAAAHFLVAPPGLVLLIGVDVGVIPESGGLDALVPKAFHTVDAARRTADVEQEVLQQGLREGGLPRVHMGQHAQH